MENCGYKVILCQPYRITAVAVAERIAFERNEEISKSVGYQIPLETKYLKITFLYFDAKLICTCLISSRVVKNKFFRKSATSVIICVTPDVLLKMLIAKETLFQEKLAVILDEFEECDYITEFVLIALRDLFKVNQFLRLILMTNACDIKNITDYFLTPQRTVYDIRVETADIESKFFFYHFSFTRDGETTFLLLRIYTVCIFF